jgi:hypothetical protein
MWKKHGRGFEVVTNVHIAVCCSPVKRKDDVATKDVLCVHDRIHIVRWYGENSGEILKPSLHQEQWTHVCVVDAV